MKVKLNNLAGWQSGHAADCKSVYAGSIPASASVEIIKRIIIFGLGYVGTSMAILLSQKEYVRAIDIDEKVNLLNNKVSPIKDNLIDRFLDKKILILKPL